MRKARPRVAYNILLPIWLLVWWPSPLWLVLGPANSLIDRLVLRWGLKGMEGRDAFCRRHCWKVCLAGFASDLVGGLLLFGAMLALGEVPGGELADTLAYGLGFNPFSHVLSLVIVLVAIAVAGLCIFLLDRWILTRAGLAAELARSAALRLAVITAPWLFLFPSMLLYR